MNSDSVPDAISVSGPVLAFPDGYGDVVRQFALGVREIGCPCQLRDTSLGQASHPETLDPEFQPLRELLAATVKTPFHLVFAIPDLFERFSLAGKTNVGYTMWETDRLPGHWPPLCNRMHALQVPSRFCKEVFERSGVTVPIQVVPIPVDTSKFDDLAPAPLLSSEKPQLTFYSIFQWHERKNPAALIAAFVQAFESREPVRLVLKTHLGGVPDEKDVILEQAGAIATAAANERTLPTIVVIPGRLVHEQVLQLHLQSDVYVGPVRGEGFGLPIFDAVLAGNHVIATRFSSPLDYLEVQDESGQELYDLLDYRLVSCQGDGLYTRDQQWADVNVNELAIRLRRCYISWVENGYQLPRQRERNWHAARVRQQWHRLNSVRISLLGLKSLAPSLNEVAPAKSV
jgi:glycosyltransferase involved in cell wall biosynthesis